MKSNRIISRRLHSICNMSARFFEKRGFIFSYEISVFKFTKMSSYWTNYRNIGKELAAAATKCNNEEIEVFVPDLEVIEGDSTDEWVEPEDFYESLMSSSIDE